MMTSVDNETMDKRIKVYVLVDRKTKSLKPVKKMLSSSNSDYLGNITFV